MWAGLQGLIDEVPVDDVLRFERELLEYLRHNGEALQNIRETKAFDDDTAPGLREQIAEFKKGFQTSEGKLLAGREEHAATDPDDVEPGTRSSSRSGADRAMPASCESCDSAGRSVTTIKKVTRAMELIAASRIIKAQQRAQAAAPYARELTSAVSAVATFSNVDHPLTTESENPTPGGRAADHLRPRSGRARTRPR